MTYLIANWKQNKNINDIEYWFDTYSKSVDADQIIKLNLKIIIAPPFSLVNIVSSKIIDLNLQDHLKIAVQDISAYDDGPHTGQVGFNQLPDNIDYAIVGHSETRMEGQDYSKINQKIERILDKNKSAIFCFSNPTEFFELNKAYSYNSYKEKITLAYEPIESIGTGEPASIDNLRNIKETVGVDTFIYGGSVDENSIHKYLKEEFISGFLVGGASLDPIKFSHLTNILLKNINN